mgnify:CR=1 FL=1
MPVTKRKSGKSKSNPKLPQNNDMSKNYVSIRPPSKNDTKIIDKEIFEGSNKKIKKKY